MKINLNIDKMSYPVLFLLMIFIFTILVCIVGYIDSKYVTVCTRSSIVEEILSIDYRDADILLENGMTVTVNQATLEPGDKWCLSSHRVHKNDL